MVKAQNIIKGIRVRYSANMNLDVDQTEAQEEYKLVGYYTTSIETGETAVYEPKII